MINYIGITRDNKLFCTSKLKDVIFRVANMAVMQFPPKLSLKIDVNKEFLITIKQILLRKIIVQFYLQLNNLIKSFLWEKLKIAVDFFFSISMFHNNNNMKSIIRY